MTVFGKDVAQLRDIRNCDQHGLKQESDGGDGKGDHHEGELGFGARPYRREGERNQPIEKGAAALSLGWGTSSQGKPRSMRRASRVSDARLPNEVTTMLADAMVVPTVAVNDLERAKGFFAEQLGLPLLDETPFAMRFGAGKGTQMSVRRGQPNVGQTAAHFEVDDIKAIVRELSSRGVAFEE